MATTHPVEAMPSMATATRHGKRITDQSVAQPCPDDFIHVAGHERNYPDTLTGYQVPQGPRNRPADKRADAQLGQAQRPGQRRAVELGFLRRADRLPGPRLDDTHLAGHIEYRRNPVVP